jgi:hypothetical protein
MQPERESSMKCFMRPLQCSSLRVETYNTFIIRSSNGVNNTATFANANSQDPTRTRKRKRSVDSSAAHSISV